MSINAVISSQMSSLIFHIEKTQAYVATDTLAVKPDGTPLMFCSKAVYLPHLRTIIVGTGLGHFSSDWANEVNTRLVLAGIRNLDYHTPDALRRRWREVKSLHTLPEEMTTTVYQIGIGEDDEEIYAFAYRSSDDFQSELLLPGTHAKPECTFITSDNKFSNFHTMMLEQRRIQETKPENQRLYIGGECILMHLTKDTFGCARLFRFDDFDAQLYEMFQAF